MSVVVLCQSGFMNGKARQKLIEAARLAIPYSGAELLLAGDDMDDGGEPRQTTVAIRFSKIDEARRFLDRMQHVVFAEPEGPKADFRLLAPWPPTIGQLPLMVFP